MEIEFGILGPLVVRREAGPVALGGGKPRALLAMLLLRPNEPVSPERLAAGLWGEDAPHGSVKTVQVHVSRLRKALGDPELLTTGPAGYRVRVRDGELDAEQFERLVERGRRELAAGNAEAASGLFREGLALWRGLPLAELSWAPFAPAEIARLEEQRLAAVEVRIEADLAAGRHSELIAELQQLVTAQPMRERLHAQLMLALYRAGRQADALDAYRQARDALAEQLGIEPTSELRDLERAILMQDPALASPPRVAAPPPEPTVKARGRAPFVGRRAERDELLSALAEARSGQGSLFLVAGEAGIGKTRLAESVAEAAADHGDTVLWGSAWAAGGAPAYWPWAQVIRELVQRRPSDEMVEDLGFGAPYVAHVAPELVQRLPGFVERPVPLESEAERFSAFDATTSFVCAAAARRPIVIVLDDLQAADVATVRLLEFLAGRIHRARILAIGTTRLSAARRDSELTLALADLGKVAQRLVLGGLSRSELQELVAAQGREPSPTLVDQLHDVTEGNPLFADELMRLLAAEGTLAAAPGRVRIPQGVRHTIRRRLDPLPADVARTLTAAAVIGPEFSLETLSVVVQEERVALLGQLDEAAAARLVDEVPGLLGRYRFAHGLIRETLYDDLPAQDRVALHAAIGEALLTLYGDRPDAPLSELAHHFLQAAPAGDAARAADYAARAGEHALASMAWEQAIALFDDALTALGLQLDDPARRGAVLLSKGRAEMRAGRHDAGRSTLADAAEVGRRLGDEALLAQAALASAPLGLATALADEQHLIPLLEEALEHLPASDGDLRARLLARLAAALYWSAPAERREPLALEAIDMARRLGDPATLALVLSDAHLATWDPDSPERALPWAGEIATLAAQVGNMELAMLAHSWRISLLLAQGEVEVVDGEMDAYADAAERLHQQRAKAQALFHRCARLLMAGEFDEVEQLIEQTAEYAALLQEDQILGMRLAALVFVMREIQGRLGELEAAVQHFADAQPAMPVWRCGLMCVYLQTGREAELRSQYEALAADDFASLPRDNLWLPSLAFAAEACAHLGDRRGARTLRELLAPYSGQNVVTPGVAYIGPVDRYLALVAVTEGDDDAAAEWFAAARRVAAARGARPTSARLALDQARALRDKDPARSAELAAEAVTEAEAVGLGALAEHARSLQISSAA